jgi:DnaJ-class molecular chaperone
MSDYYNTLGVDRNASQDDIRKAYRRMASQHHPDRGGDTAKFQDIQAAYETLSDPEKKAQYDNPQQHMHHGGHPFGGMPGGFEEFFASFGMGPGGFGFNFGPQHRQARNRNLNFQAQITLEDAFFGKDLVATVRLPSGKDQVINVKIPRGIQDGTTLRLEQLGDDSYPNMPRGDIHLTVQIQPHHKFRRNGDDLIMSLEVNAIDAMLGKNLQVDTLEGKTLEIKINPGTQHGQTLAASGHGMPNMHDPRFIGRLLIELSIKIPMLDDEQKLKLAQIFN